MNAAHPSGNTIQLFGGCLHARDGFAKVIRERGRTVTSQALESVSTTDAEAKASPEQMRQRILDLEAALLAMPEHHVDLPITHHFARGLYLREMFIPKGVTLTGKIHKTEHLCILSQGEVSVWTGDSTERFKASRVLKSLPGAKRAIYAHEDSIWINVHFNPTDESEEEKLEEIFIAKTFEEALGHSEPKPMIEGEK